MSLKDFETELQTAQTAWEAVVDLLSQSRYDFEKVRPILNQQSFTTFTHRVRLVFESLLAMLPGKEGDIEAAVLGGRLRDLRPNIQGFISHVDSALSQMRQNWREKTSIKDGNEHFAWQLFENEQHYASLDLTSNFSQLNAFTDALLGIVGSTLPLTKAKSVSDLSKRAEALGKVIREIESLRKQAQVSATATEVSAEHAAGSAKEAKNAETEINVSLAAIRALQNQASTDVGAVASLVEQIKTTGANAGALESMISDYQAKFDSFQKQLEDRNTEFKRFQQERGAIEQTLALREQEIARLSELADVMISGATTAGLAKSMEDTRSRYETRMNTARRGFYIAVVLLIASSLPLAAHLLPGLLGDWIPGMDTTAEGSPYATLGKLMLLLPATWLTAFFTKSYAELFHLEREYAHKAALAMSVDGFKRQAPGFEQEITAEVFLEIRNNPAKGQPVEPASHPLYDVLSKAVGKVLDRKTEYKE